MKDLSIVETVTVNEQPIEFKRNDSEIYTDSLTVAKVFGKQHKNVLRDIEDEIGRLKIEPATKGNTYLQGVYLDAQNKNRKMYYLTRDQVTLLVMGFSGAKARAWKKEYISAFNKVVESHRGLTQKQESLIQDNLRLKESLKAREQSLLPKTRETLDKSRALHFSKLKEYFIEKGESADAFNGMLIRSYMLLHLLVTGDIPANIVKDRVGEGVQSIHSGHTKIRLSDFTVAINFYSNEEMELFNDALLPTLKSMVDAISTNKQLTPRILADSFDKILMENLKFKRNIQKGDKFQGKNRAGLDNLVERLIKKEISIESFTDSVISLRDGRTFFV